MPPGVLPVSGQYRQNYYTDQMMCHGSGPVSESRAARGLHESESTGPPESLARLSEFQNLNYWHLRVRPPRVTQRHADSAR